jgi:hypothetical protein
MLNEFTVKRLKKARDRLPNSGPAAFLMKKSGDGIEPSPD